MRYELTHKFQNSGPTVHSYTVTVLLRVMEVESRLSSLHMRIFTVNVIGF